MDEANVAFSLANHPVVRAWRRDLIADVCVCVARPQFDAFSGGRPVAPEMKLTGPRGSGPGGRGRGRWRTPWEGSRSARLLNQEERKVLGVAKETSLQAGASLVGARPGPTKKNGSRPIPNEPCKARKNSARDPWGPSIVT